MRTGRPSDRELRRKRNKDHKQIHDYIEWIPRLFEKALFDERSTLDYEKLFEKCNRVWVRLAKTWNAKYPRRVQIDADWFRKTYEGGNAKDLKAA